MSELFKVSQSKVKTYRRCRRAYHNKYVEKLRSKKKGRPLVFGSIVHDMIEADANGDDPFAKLDEINLADAKLFAAEREQYGEIIEDIRMIMTEYFEFYKNDDFVYTRKNGRYAEHEFEIEIVPGVLWNGKIDSIGRTADKLRWLRENKTFNRMPNEDDRWRNLQAVTYTRAIDMLGWKPVDGVCWNYIHSKPPPRPGILKNGEMSQKKMATLPIAIMSVIEENNLDPKDYKSYIDQSEIHRGTWFNRVFNPVQRSVVDKIFDDFITTIQEMVERHGKAKDMNIERHCSWCEFEPLCRAEITGADVDYVKERNFEVSNYSSTKAAEPRRKKAQLPKRRRNRKAA